MEAVAQGVEDYLIDGLSFKLNPGASYITNRRSVTYFPTGGNEYSPTGVKVIRVVLTGNDWIDPATFRMSFTLNNTSGTAGRLLRPLGGPWQFFRRVRLLIGGAIVEDIDWYNRCHEMFHCCTNGNTRDNDLAESFGQRIDSYHYQTINGNTTATATNYLGLPASTSRTVYFKPLLGIFNQSKYLPIRYAPITLEFELVNNLTDPIINPADDTRGTPVWTAANTSTLWMINNVQAKMDVVTLDNVLDNEYAQHVLAGKSLPINYNTYISQLQSVLSADIAVNITRALTRLKSVFITFDGTHTGSSTDWIPLLKTTNNFIHPMNSSATYDPSKEMEFQIQIGSKLFPEYPVKSLGEAYYQLRKTLGIASSNWHSMNIAEAHYRNFRFIVGIDTEKVLAAGFTGLNSKAGDLMTLKFKALSGGTVATDLPQLMYVHLHADCILNIRDTGVEVFD
jgi:hypothetical protein